MTRLWFQKDKRYELRFTVFYSIKMQVRAESQSNSYGFIREFPPSAHVLSCIYLHFHLSKSKI